MSTKQKTFMLCHGAWGGGWSWKKMHPLMQAAGHRLLAPTYTGLGERVHLANPDVDLETHIRDILNVVIDPGGGIEVLNPDGSKGRGSSLTQNIYNKRPNTMTYTKAGLGPHAEVVTDPGNPGRSIFVEIKGTEPGDCREWSTACP